MTIGSTIPARVSFNCDGATTVFPIPIQAYQATDITVILTAPASAGGAQTPLTLNSDYSMASAGTLQPPQWTLTTLAATPYAAGYTLQAFINPIVQQQSQYVQGQAFPSLAVQTNLDRLTQMVQRLQDEVSRAIRAPDGDVSPSMLLPPASSRILMYLAFDANGNASVVSSLPSGATLTPSGLAAVLYPVSAAEAAAGVAVVNGLYAYGTIDRYGTNTTPGTTDMTAALTAANAQWVHGGAAITAGANYAIAESVTVAAPINFVAQGMLSPTGNAIITLNGPVSAPAVKIFNQTLTKGGVAWANAPTSGVFGYTAGTYTNVPITGGSGTGAVANIQIFSASGTNFFSVVMTSLGTGYQTTDTLSASNAHLGGAGAGFSFNPFVTQITGTFGGVDMIDRWFGVVADGNGTTGGGTNNTPFFQAAINCAVSRNGEASNAQAPSRILTLAGWYLVESRVSVGDNVIWRGAGKWGSNIFAPTAFSDAGGIIAINGGGTYPTTFSGFTVGGQLGGCSGNGIVVTKNATFVSDVWVTGLSDNADSIGIVLSETTVYLRDWVCELCSTGVLINQIGVTVDSGETFQSQVSGFLIDNGAAAGSPGRVLISNVRCQDDVQGAMVLDNAVQVSISNVHAVTTATNNFTGGAFSVVGASNDINFTGCTARAAALGGTTGAGFNLQNSTNITLTGCEGVIMQGGGLVSNGCSGLNISGGAYSGNGNYGIRIINGDIVNIGGFTAAANAFDGVNDQLGTAGKHLIGPCFTSNNGGWGLNLGAGATSFINSVGNTSEGNTSGSINKTGTTANINTVGNF